MGSNFLRGMDPVRCWTAHQQTVIGPSQLPVEVVAAEEACCNPRCGEFLCVAFARALFAMVGIPPCPEQMERHWAHEADKTQTPELWSEGSPGGVVDAPQGSELLAAARSLFVCPKAEVGLPGGVEDDPGVLEMLVGKASHPSRHRPLVIWQASIWRLIYSQLCRRALRSERNSPRVR